MVESTEGEETKESLATPTDPGLPEHPTASQVTTWTRQNRFLEEYARCGGVYVAAEVAECTARAHELWNSSDAFGYQTRYAAAQQRYLEKLQLEADRRAVDGVERPIVSRGEVVTSYQQYSDNLLMFRMKKLDPSYRDNTTLTVDVTPITSLLDELRSKGRPKVVEGSVVAEGPLGMLRG